MPHGFFTVEQWRKGKWVTVCHLDASHSVSDAMRDLERRDRAGLFRVTQTQRLVWAEKVDKKLRLRKWHAGRPETLANTAKAFERDKGKWPRKRN